MNINLIEVLKEERDTKFEGGLYYTTQVKFAYNSNRIEGSRLTENQTRFIFENNTLPHEDSDFTNIDDIIVARNHFKCFDFMLETIEEELSERIIKEFHSIIVSDTLDASKPWFNVGDYKQSANKVADIETSEPHLVRDHMNDLLSTYNKIDEKTLRDIIDFHKTFETIHPFQDGNGRVGRLIMFRECLVNDIMPFIIDSDLRNYYYEGLRKYQINGVNKYLMTACEAAQVTYYEIVKYFYPSLVIDQNQAVGI